MDLEAFPVTLRERFEPRGLLGEGAMGAVFLALDRQLERMVAVKLVSLQPDEVLRARSAREAQAMASIRHPNVVTIYAFDVLPEGPYIVMECLQGSPLAAARDVDPVEAMLMVAEGLAEVHRQGFTHRDVKPQNIMWTLDRRAVLLDFGLVRHDGETQLTRTRVAVGTPLFLAPEVLWGGEASPASDWYAWGVSLFWLLERRYPYTYEVVQKVIAGGDFPEPEFRRIASDGPVAGALRALLGAVPEKRPGGPRELRDRLVPFLEPTTPVVYTPSPTRAAGPPPSPPAGPPDTSEAMSRRWAVRSGLVGLVVGVGLGLGAGLRVGPDPGGGAEQGGAHPRPVRASAEEMLAELEAAAAVRLDELGRVESGDGKGLEPSLGAQDPASFGTLLARLPKIREALGMAGSAPQRLEVVPEHREGLERCDRRFEELGLPPPFRPLLVAAPPATGDARYPRIEAYLEGIPSVPPPEHPGGWAGLCFGNLERALEEDEFLGRSSPSSVADPLILESIRSLSWSPPNLRSFALKTFWIRDSRSAVERVVAVGRERVRLALAAAMREIEARPGEGARVARVAAELARPLRVFLRSGWWTAPAEVLFPGADDHPEAAFLAANWLEQSLGALEAAKVDPALHVAARTRLLAVAAGIDPTSPDARAIRAEATVRLVETLGERGEVGAVRRVLEELMSDPAGYPERARFWILRSLHDRLPAPWGLSLDEAQQAWIRAQLVSLAASPGLEVPDVQWIQERRGTLAR